MGKPSSGLGKWTGTKGDDTAVVSSNDALIHTSWDGGAGYDTLDLSHLTSGISINVIVGSRGSGVSNVWNTPLVGSWWTFASDHLANTVHVDGIINNFEKIVGTPYNDYLELRGGSVARVLDGGAGDDSIYMAGAAGSNTAIGGLGSDQLFGGGHSTDLYIGGTYANGIATKDGASDSFDLQLGTILDFEPGIDHLYVDGPSPASLTGVSWTTVSTPYGPGAELVTSSAGSITLVGVTADFMNSTPLGFTLAESNHVLTSGPGDDMIVGTSQVETATYYFPHGSGHDEFAGFDTNLDTLDFSNETSAGVTWSEITYHGEQALVATYDGGNATLTLDGLGLSDLANVHVIFGG